MLFGRDKLVLNETERAAMRRAGRFNAQLMDYVRTLVRPGITTGEIDRLIHRYTLDHGHLPACLGYQGFPKSSCTSVNEVVCHGIPGRYALRQGDIVNIDCTTIVDGWHGDSSETFLVGECSAAARAVVQCAFDCLHRAIEALKPNCRASEIGEAVVREAHARGYSVVREYVGHGLGRKFHQQPSIPHAPTREARREILRPGMCFTIEPMVNVGEKETELDSLDGWTVRTADRTLSAQFEHTILMTETGPEILTTAPQGPKKGHRF